VGYPVRAYQLRTAHVAGLSFGRSVGALARKFYRRHPAVPRTLILASAYAGWAGSLPADVAEQRLRQALVLADLSSDEFMGALLPTMFSEAMPPESVDEFGLTMLAFHPVGFRAAGAGTSTHPSIYQECCDEYWNPPGDTGSSFRRHRHASR
jgi:hypothetical protein